jgi:hypothetical protein
MQNAAQQEKPAQFATAGITPQYKKIVLQYVVKFKDSKKS